MIEQLKTGIYRICIPFDNIYTSSFVLTEGTDAIILDSGSNDEDAIKYIIPEVSRLKLNVQYLVSSHSHSDHNGGINALKKAFPSAISASISDNSDDYCLSDGEILLKRYQTLNLNGHSDDCLGILDTKTNTLLSCDCLQVYGVGKYRTYVSDLNEYLKSINRVRNLSLNAIIASHEYEPCGSIAEGGKIKVFLDECENAVKNISK